MHEATESVYRLCHHSAPLRQIVERQWRYPCQGAVANGVLLHAKQTVMRNSTWLAVISSVKTLVPYSFFTQSYVCIALNKNVSLILSASFEGRGSELVVPVSWFL
jgi:hypothetical protein